MPFELLGEVRLKSTYPDARPNPDASDHRGGTAHSSAAPTTKPDATSQRVGDPSLTAANSSSGAAEHVSTAGSVARDAAVLSSRIAQLRDSLFAPSGGKTMRALPAAEVSRLLQVPDSYLRHLAKSGEGPLPSKVNGRRFFSLEQVAELRTTIHAKGEAQTATAGWPTRNLDERVEEDCKVIAVANFKGGSGKTTTAAHLAQYLALRGYRTLAVDLDPQASLSALYGHQPETDISEGETLYGAIRYDDPRPTRAVVRSTYVHLLDLIPGNLELHEFEHDTPRAMTVDAGKGDVPFFARVAVALDSVAPDYDVIILDCPPQLGFLTLGALCAATGVLITVHPQMLDIASMSQFLNMTADLMSVVEEAGAPSRLDFMRYLVTRHEPQDVPQTQVIDFLRGLFPERILDNAMVKSAAITDAGLSKQTLYEVPREEMDRRTYDRARASLDAVNGEIEGLIRSAWGRT